MKKLRSIFLCQLLFISFAANNLYPENSVSGREVISILYFDNSAKNREYEWLSKGIADMLISDVAGSGSVDVVERNNLNKILGEQQLSLTGLTDDNRAIEIGKLVSARKLIYGSFIIQGRSVVINARLTDTVTGKIISTFTVKGSVENILFIQAELSSKAMKALGINVPVNIKSDTGSSIDAVKNYYEGLDLFDKGAINDARKKFEEASRLDPYYLKPYQGIEESYKFLKDFTKMRHQREVASLYDKINRINNRLKETPWKTFADIALNPYYEKMRKENNALYEKEIYAYHQGDTPAVCTWNLQHNLSELADLYVEHFNDTGKAELLNKEIISITEKSRKVFAKDPFLPEILYSAILASRNLDDWRSVKTRSEELMTNYPDFRMMWAVEDFYKSSLEKISKSGK